LTHPDRFAGVATLDGALPNSPRLLSCINRVRRLPLMLASSRYSAAYPEARVCRDLTLLHSAGCRVAVRQYPGDDDLTTEMLADVNRWAMEILCGA
jgi:phospholipase/carboxylesterase